MTGAGPAGTEAGSEPGEGGSEPGEGGSGSGPGSAGCGAHHAAPSRLLVPALLFIALVVAAVGSLGAPLITSVATYFGVTLASAQWTLTATLLSGAVATPVLGRLGTGPRRRRAVLATLAIVMTGGVLTVTPLGFGWLLAGRAAQGTGLGLTALMMATARDHLSAGADGSSGSGSSGSAEPSAGGPGSAEPSAGGRGLRRSRSGPRDRAASAIALISVASTAGIGVGYPVAGLLTELAGLRAAYTLGLVVTAAALAIAVLALPPGPAAARTTAAPPGTTRPTMPPGSDETGGAPRASLDVPGAILLAAGLVTLLITIGDPGLWQRHLTVAGGLLAAAAILLTAWAAYERTVTTPLADVSLLRHPAVARANIAMLAGGAGMYLLLTTLTRYVQTPQSAGYGFGVSTFVAGLALVPFSALGFAAGRLTPRLSGRIGPDAVLTVSAVVVLAAFAMFALARASFAEALVAMALAGCGVGGFSAAMPAVILAVTPARETASAMGINQVVRSVGFSVGSAAGGLILAAVTSPGQTFPASGGYTAAAGAGVVIMAVTAAITGAGVRAGRRRYRLARAGLDR